MRNFKAARLNISGTFRIFFGSYFGMVVSPYRAQCGATKAGGAFPIQRPQGPWARVLFWTGRVAPLQAWNTACRLWLCRSCWDAQLQLLRQPRRLWPAPETGSLGAREGGRTLRKDVLLPSKHLVSAFYETLPSKTPSKNLVFTETLTGAF